MIQNKLRYKFQLYDKALGGMMAGPAISGSGGMVMICDAGLTSKVATVDKNGVAQANPLALTSGSAEFYTAITKTSVDLYIMAPDGQFVTLTGVKPDAALDIPVDRYNPHQLAIIPFLGSDYNAGAENDTGFDLPAKALVTPNLGVQVTVLQAAKTLDVGMLSTEGGGAATGLLAAISLAALGVISAQSRATKTRGSKFVDGAAGSPDNGYAVDSAAARSLGITPLAATTTAAGRIFIPYILLTTGQPTLQ